MNVDFKLFVLLKDDYQRKEAEKNKMFGVSAF